MLKKYLLWLLLVPAAMAQNFVTITASNILNGGNGLLPSGTISFQAVGTNQQAISYQAGGGGQQILMPTVCAVTAGAIAPGCLVANVLLTQPQNLCFNATIKNSAGKVVLGGTNSGYQCLNPVPNNAWCVAGVCNFDTYPPNLPSAMLIINMPFPQTITLGGVYAGDCAIGSVQIGVNSNGHIDCGPGGGVGGAGVWGAIAGTLSNQVDLQTALSALAPLLSPALQGTPTVPTPPLNDNSIEAANTSWVQQQLYAPLLSPIFTGTPVAPTPLTGDSSTKLATTAWVNAQGYGVGTGNVNGPGSSVVGNIALFNSTNGRTLLDAGFAFPLAAVHIGTFTAGSNGLVASATTDTTNASNIASGTLPAARLPLPSSTTLGGVKSLAATSHQWINSISTAGTPASSQPACADLSNAAPSCSVDTTSASNITTGTMSPARLGILVAGSNGLAASATTDATNATNITSGTLANARLGILVAGFNGLAASATTDATNASNISSGALAVARLAAATPVTLTDATTITWAVGTLALANAKVTLGGNRTLNLTGMLSGGNYVLAVTQDATGGRALTLGTGCTWKVSGGGSGAIFPTVTPNAVDILAFVYDGTNCYANFSKNFN